MITNSLGKEIDLFNLKLEDIVIHDIITALPNICRYGGRCPVHYSVAQHSIELAQYFLKRGRKDLAKMAALHDACEAYLGDMIYPLKIQIPEFMKLESDMCTLIYNKYDVDVTLDAEFFWYDRNISVNEMKALGIYESNKTRATVRDLVGIDDLVIKPLPISYVRALFKETLEEVNICSR